MDGGSETFQRPKIVTRMKPLGYKSYFNLRLIDPVRGTGPTKFNEGLFRHFLPV